MYGHTGRQVKQALVIAHGGSPARWNYTTGNTKKINQFILDTCAV